MASGAGQPLRSAHAEGPTGGGALSEGASDGSGQGSEDAQASDAPDPSVGGEAGGPAAAIARRAHAALAEAERRGVPPDPRAFALFYAYLGGEDPELVAAVDSALAPGQAHVDAVERLHDEHLALGADAAGLLRLGALLAGEVGTVCASLARRAESDGAFRGKLTEARDGMSLFSRPGEVRRTLRDLIEVAEAHAEQTELFAAELDGARAQIDELNGELVAVREHASRDHLTGLYNRSRLDLGLDVAVAAREKGGGRFSLVLADLDRFKSVNDRHGHPVGDSVLRHFARVLRENVQGRDLAARFGGEEFALVLQEADALGARHVAERIRQDFASRAFVITGSRERLRGLTASFGVAEHRLGETAADLVARADAALYTAKSKGRNRVSTAD